MGRLIRLGTASMQNQDLCVASQLQANRSCSCSFLLPTQDGGEFVRLESLDLQKYAQRPAIAKALCDYMQLGNVLL